MEWFERVATDELNINFTGEVRLRMRRTMRTRRTMRMRKRTLRTRRMMKRRMSVRNLIIIRRRCWRTALRNLAKKT